MSLRRKLIVLNVAFAAFAASAALATIYGVELHVRRAMRGFEELVDQSLFLEQLGVEAQAELSRLHDVVDGRRTNDDSFQRRREAFFTRLNEGARFSGARQGESTQNAWRDLLEVGERLRVAVHDCVRLAEDGRAVDADRLLAQRIENDLLPLLEIRLQHLRWVVDASRRDSVFDVMAVNTQLLWLAVAIGTGGVALVAVGAIVIRRWFIAPIATLHAGTIEFARGNLAYRVHVSAGDELGSLGEALNSMASSLRVSQTKYRSLFENLRDAVIIVDRDGRVLECRDADTAVLATSPDAVLGRHLLEAWPAWRLSGYDWEALIQRVAGGAAHARSAGIMLPRADGPPIVVDVVAYPVEYADARYAAILLRDASERHRLQRLSQRAETMEAVIHFARGIAHDFKNLLNSAVTTLSLIKEEHADAARAQKAILACRQAAGLSRKLTEFADTDVGRPEILCLSATVRMIVSSIEESLPPTIELVCDCVAPIPVFMDRDHLTQVALNLIQNAREALAAGGRLTVSTRVVDGVDPLHRGAPGKYAVLSIADTGCGMTAEVKERLFEPFFSTKPSGTHGRRGMGLAIAYSAVEHAEGFLQVDSAEGVGTTFRVFLPLAATASREQLCADAAGRVFGDGSI